MPTISAKPGVFAGAFMECNFFKLTRYLKENRSGGIAVSTALVLPILIVAMGFSIDCSRAIIEKQKLQLASDKAALAGSTAVRNGLATPVALQLASTIFAANLDPAMQGSGLPSINLSGAGPVFSASVEAKATVPTMFSGILNIYSIPVTASAASMAQSGPSGNGGMGAPDAVWGGPSGGGGGGKSPPPADITGGGTVWGDPHFEFKNSTTGESAAALIACKGKRWYNNLSDGGIQWNTLCRDDGSGLFFDGTKIFAGTHTISFTPSAQFWNHENWNRYDDCGPFNGSSVCGYAYPSVLTIDGKVIDPSDAKYGGQATFTVLDDTDEDVTVSLQMSAYPVPASFGDLGSSYANYFSVTVTTKSYVIGLSYPLGYQFSYIQATNAGMCGNPGGLYGSFVAGRSDANSADYAIEGADFKAAQFYWEPTCQRSGGSIAMLTK